MPGPLVGIKVLDVGTYAIGPCAAGYLGFLGADVIRIEHPRGDGLMDVRPLMKGMGASYVNANLQKKNIQLDLKDPQTVATARALVRWADVFIENRLTGVIDRLGLGYQEAAEINPRIVYVSSPGFGSTGPCSSWPCLDVSVQALSGFTSIQGSPGGPPELWRNTGELDQMAAAAVVQATLLGLMLRRRTGVGQHIEAWHLSTSIFGQATRLAEFFATGQDPARQGSASAIYAPSQSFRCLDGKYVNITATDESCWARLCEALELEVLVGDDRFGSNEQRLRNKAELAKLIESRTVEAPVRWWVVHLGRHQVPCGPLHDFDGILGDPQVRSQEMIVRVPTQWGALYHGAYPWRFSETACGPMQETHAPGEDEEEVLRLLEKDAPHSQEST